MKPYYQDKYATIYHGDCREVMPTIGKVQLLLTDPPYGVNLGHHGAANETRPQYLKKSGYNEYNDTEDNYLNVVVPAIKFALEICERGVVFCVGTRMWDLPRPAAVSALYLPAGCGRCCWGFQSFAHFLLYGKCPDLRLSTGPIGWSSTERADPSTHPCPKPLGWMVRLMKLASRPGDIVLDPFAGSGTTLVAAKAQGNSCIGIELEEKYCEIAAKRLSQGVLDFG